MPSNLDKYRSDLEALTALGDRMLSDLQFRHFKKTGQLKTDQIEAAKKIEGLLEAGYQRWYSEATAVIRQLMPDRLQEFTELYKGDGRRKAVDTSTYNIQDWLNGVRAGQDRYTHAMLFDDFAAVTMRFTTQLQILKAVARRFESSLFDIRQLVQADLFDSELDAAHNLAKHGFLRAAGAIAGVVLESHLAQVAANHSLVVRKKNPTIADLYDLLKNESVIDVPAWRQFQRLGDIRNLCDHNREREPTSDEVDELISGVEKTTKTLF